MYARPDEVLNDRISNVVSNCLFHYDWLIECTIVKTLVINTFSNLI